MPPTPPSPRLASDSTASQAAERDNDGRDVANINSFVAASVSHSGARRRLAGVSSSVVCLQTREARDLKARACRRWRSSLALDRTALHNCAAMSMTTRATTKVGRRLFYAADRKKAASEVKILLRRLSGFCRPLWLPKLCKQNKAYEHAHARNYYQGSCHLYAAENERKATMKWRSYFFCHRGARARARLFARAARVNQTKSCSAAASIKKNE